MKYILKYLILVFQIMAFSALVASARTIDNGTNRNGKMVVSETLSTRCGLSSNDPIVTDDCMKRLASDYVHNKEPIHNMSSSEEFNAIISEYMSTYIAFSAEQLHKSSSHAEDSDKKAGKSISTEITIDNDARADIEANNNLATDNSARLIDALDVRSMEININNIEKMLETVKRIANDIVKDSDEDKKLRTIPLNTESSVSGGNNG